MLASINLTTTTTMMIIAIEPDAAGLSAGREDAWIKTVRLMCCTRMFCQLASAEADSKQMEQRRQKEETIKSHPYAGVRVSVSARCLSAPSPLTPSFYLGLAIYRTL